MANQEHLDILKQGVEVWNKWRETHKDVKPDLTKTDFSETVLSGIVLNGANFSGTELSEACFFGANLSRVDFSGSDLYGVVLRAVDLNCTDFRGATIGFTIFTDVDLSSAVGLDSIYHESPSSLGIDTIYKSKGNIPEVFLRGCGLPDEFIAS